MSRSLLFLFINLLALPGYSQTINRVEVSGVLLSKNNDIEAVTVFNKSSNKGTITDAEGRFKLHVGLNDVIEISALQFQTVKVNIDEDIIASKALKIQLVEQVNQLDAVTLSSGLSGNMGADIAQVKTVKPMILDMGNMEVDFEYNGDKAFDNTVIQDHLTSVIDPGARKYQPDLLKILKFLTKSKIDLKLTKEVFVGDNYQKPKDILSVYSLNDLKELFEIPEVKLNAYVAFIENNGIKPDLFKDENRILLIEFLVKQKEQFLKTQHVKN
ncbi:carboxypeptidase-like regulatory domain-containing protein [Algibacter pectinivorans]|uniref:carboxypeptidase-like regulatory domain-containing protein n=1 Tax=Algibacter pectinivorans TaxID=870482 RepID=UPI000B841356|nr:carboxypeptidase-like regulatory domain-containing protein [Algibacter pectinivorans]